MTQGSELEQGAANLQLQQEQYDGLLMEAQRERDVAEGSPFCPEHSSFMSI